MRTEFTPFTLQAPVDEAGEGPFAPVSVEVQAPEPIHPPPEKAAADLQDALRLGLDVEALEAFRAALGGVSRTPFQALPLTLRDFSTRTTDPDGNASHREPSIVVTRDGDIVQKVTVECPCGERISLDCIY